MKKLLIYAIGACILLSGCATKEIRYCHNTKYRDAMNSYLTDEANLDEQRIKMDEYFSECANSGYEPAPGSYAHMGILYSKNGNTSKAFEYFNLEKQKFPDAAHYMNFLMSQKGAKNKAANLSTKEIQDRLNLNVQNKKNNKK